MSLRLFNTLTRSIDEFKPIKKGKVGLYTCGPTVYNFAHIGNLRTYVFEDLLKRVLRHDGLKVKHVMNITDVGHLVSDGDEGEDKMEKGARREGKTAWEIADFYTQAFRADIAALNIIEPDIWCRATEYIAEQIALIKKLEKKKFTYRTVDGIYFDTTRLPYYGKLANLQRQELIAGARVEVGDKKNPTDFALWKFSPPLVKRQMEWSSPWGVGFPGWHVECSAMASKHLGQPFDIHCGGIDHVPVHHTNEIAQSEAANGKPLANFWMHGEFLLTGDEKMAKSGDNFLTLKVLTDHGHTPLAYRYLLLQTHYRKQLTFSWDALQAAQNGLEHLYSAAAELPDQAMANDEVLAKFSEIINDDLNIAGALAFVWDRIKSKQIDQKTLLAFDDIFGLKIADAIQAKNDSKKQPLPEKVKRLICDRDQARQNKNWQKSDELRAAIEALGYEVKDTKSGTSATKK